VFEEMNAITDYTRKHNGMWFYTRDEVLQKNNLSINELYTMLKANNITLRGGGAGNRTTSDVKIRIILDDRAKGVKCKETCTKLGINKDNYYYVLRKYGK
jgi:hypothetical protein